MRDANQTPADDSDYDQAARIARKVLDYADRHRSPPKPRAYEVWYTYVTGDDPALSARMESELVKSDVVDLGTIEQIYQDHFLHKRLSSGMNRIGDELDAELREMQAVIRDGLGSNNRFLASLGQAQGKINSASRNHDAKRILMNLLELGREHAAQTEAVSGELTKARAQVLELQRELHRLRNTAYLDHLTQISNRRHLDEMLDREITIAESTGQPLSFALADLDHFKGLNDTHGHAIGDAVLKHFAGLLKKSIKGQDIPARYGGEEFAIVFPKTTLFGAARVSDSIRTAFHDTEFVLSHDKSPIGRLSVSFGVTQFLPGETKASLLRRADDLLYQAKRRGRNRVETDM